MEKNELLEVKAKAKEWLSDTYDAQTRAQVQALLDAEDPAELVDAFYKNLEFGTGGLRGIMGVGTNRMNIYTVGAATQGDRPTEVADALRPLVDVLEIATVVAVDLDVKEAGRAKEAAIGGELAQFVLFRRARADKLLAGPFENAHVGRRVVAGRQAHHELLVLGRIGPGIGMGHESAPI